MNAISTAPTPALATIGTDQAGDPITIDLTSQGDCFRPGANVLIEGPKSSGKTRLLASIREAAQWRRVKVYDLGDLSMQSDEALKKQHSKIHDRSGGTGIRSTRDGGFTVHPRRHCVVLVDDYDRGYEAATVEMLVAHLLNNQHVTVVLAAESLPIDSIRDVGHGERGWFATQIRLDSSGDGQVTRTQTVRIESLPA